MVVLLLVRLVCMEVAGCVADRTRESRVVTASLIGLGRPKLSIPCNNRYPMRQEFGASNRVLDAIHV